MSRVLLSDEVILSKSARDAVKVLLRAFARWGRPEQIVSDNAKAFESYLFTHCLATLEIQIRHTTPGSPWENAYAESLIGTLRAYLYPHIQRQKRVESVGRIYAEKVNYYNHRTHWAFQFDPVKTPLAKLAETKGRPMLEAFSLEMVQTTKSVERTVSKHGWISFRRYRLYVSTRLAQQKVLIREFLSNLVVAYKGSSVVTYSHCEQTEETSSLSTDSTPVFHDFTTGHILT